LFFQLLAVLPLCVVYYDYGRLIFMWATSSVGAFLVLTWSRQQAIKLLLSDAISLLPRIVPYAFGIVRYAYDHALASASVTSQRVALIKLSLLFFGIPSCCWSVVQYVAYTPFVQPFYYALNAVEVGHWGPPPRIAFFARNPAAIASFARPSRPDGRTTLLAQSCRVCAPR
jgi:hypothetical protein